MSIKIYDAYEFKGSLATLTKLLLEMRKAVIAAVIQDAKTNNTFNAKTLGDTMKIFDLQRELKVTLTSNEFFSVNKEREWLVPNLRSSAMVYPVGKRLFVQFFGLPRGVKVTDKRFVDYHYQNQCDPWYDGEEYEAKKAGRKPKGAAWIKKQAANYRERKMMWQRIFPRWEAPSQVGLAHDFVCEADLLEIADGIFANVHGHRVFADSEEEQKLRKACTICSMAKRGIDKDPEEVAL